MHLRTRRSLIVVLSFALVASISALVSTKDGIATGGSNGIVVLETGNVGVYTSMELGAGDKPIIAHYDNSSAQLRLLNCGNTTCTSGNVASSPSVANAFVSLDLDANGIPAVAFRTSTGPGYRLTMLRCNDLQCTSPTVTVNSIHGGDQASLELDSAGNPIVARTGIGVLHCNDPDCAGVDDSNANPVSGTYPSLELDSTGNPVIAFADVANLGILHCADADCVTPGSIEYPDAGSATGAPSLALDSAGNPVVAYNDFPSYFLKVLHCGDPDCTAGNTIATAGHGSVSSIAVDQNDRPVVAYHGGNGKLKLLHCGNPACAAGNSIRTIDYNVGAGLFPSLALDSSGNPVVAYQLDRTSYDDDLKFAYCASPACDGDGDTCADPVEEQTTAGTELYGGRRNPKNPNDYFNPTHDGQNRVDDILLVADAYYMDDTDVNPGLAPYAAGYDPDTDRTLLGPDPWDTGPPNGLQRVDDILNAVNQYFHDCDIAS